MEKNIGRILSGIALIALAVFIVLGSFGIGFSFPGNIEVWQWIVGVLLFMALIDSLRRLEFVEVFLMLGFEVMVFEPQLGLLFGFTEENWISNWLVFFVSLLVGIGMSMIFKGFHFSFKVKKNTLGDSVKYIDSSSLKNVTIRNKLGATEVRFENVCTYEGGGTLSVHNTLGQSTVYVPSGWTVKFKTVNTLGEISIDPTISASSANSSTDAPVIHINLYNKLGEIDVRPM